MTLAGMRVLPRDGEAGSAPLTTGAIAGIACGAGALFLGATSLFIVYFRRQRRYAREDYSDSDSFDDTMPRRAMAPVVTYTMDYKIDNPQHHEGSSYIYSPEQASYILSPQSTSDAASAMPTHPAYIPRALVRGSSTPSNRSVSTTSPPPPFLSLSPPYPPSISHSSKIQPDDSMIGAYLAAAAQAGPQAQSQDSPPEESDAASSSSGPAIRPAPPRSVSPTDGSSSDHNNHQQQQQQQQFPLPNGLQPLPARRKPRAYTPPRLNLAEGTAQNRSRRERPLLGKEHATISGPLAFPQFSHPPIGPPPPPAVPPAAAAASRSGWRREEVAADIWDGEGEEQWHSHASPPGDGRRTFRSRIALAGGGGGGSGSGSGSGSNSGRGRGRGRGNGNGKKKHGRKKSDRGSGGYGSNRHYTEVEIGRGSDIW
ncbi:hypothetical protein MYCTH_107095 [Thermothelomyces thermophilus ATCC 42464]|uniref:Uncharacterized protein n=1 Tax=Thermothelomyces thermophilus (strain ATCC 42464 / BCRC 31852 / DSM 1799) TaxID=573729 RepID=G2Q7X4_THET4|nr:uncharacterized protein MYCTH_107095 [Thermothelomyces thermophilus ATCC 42464]AEO56131.1 hypothetical protein MYCTH_107095 [Thermothelomyces thermophilus ATCC 42464]